MPTDNISTVNATMPYADLLQKFINIMKPGPFIPNAEFAHSIVTNGPPVTEHFRKLFSEKTTVARAEIQRFLDTKIIRPSSSAWASPIPLVKKKDIYRLCGDYRKMNSVIPDKYAHHSFKAFSWSYTANSSSRQLTWTELITKYLYIKTIYQRRPSQYPGTVWIRWNALRTEKRNADKDTWTTSSAAWISFSFISTIMIMSKN